MTTLEKIVEILDVLSYKEVVEQDNGLHSSHTNFTVPKRPAITKMCVCVLYLNPQP